MSVRRIWKSIVGLFLLVANVAAFALSVDITATPQSGPSPLNTTVAWTSVAAERCWKDDITVPLNGSENLTGVTADRMITFKCESGQNYSEVRWVAPTQNVDGTPIPATGPGSLAGFELQYATSVAALETAPKIVIAKEATAYVVENQSNATYYYRLNAFTQDLTRSDWTGPVNNTVSFLQAHDTVLIDPQNFSTVATVVYNVVKKNNGFIMVAVGTVPLNTPCDRTQSVNGYHAVSTSAVTWSGSVRPIVVVAQCTDH